MKLEYDQNTASSDGHMSHVTCLTNVGTGEMLDYPQSLTAVGLDRHQFGHAFQQILQLISVRTSFTTITTQQTLNGIMEL
jgi:hypothetical protein